MNAIDLLDTFDVRLSNYIEAEGYTRMTLPDRYEVAFEQYRSRIAHGGKAARSYRQAVADGSDTRLVWSSVKWITNKGDGREPHRPVEYNDELRLVGKVEDDGDKVVRITSDIADALTRRRLEIRYKSQELGDLARTLGLVGYGISPDQMREFIRNYLVGRAFSEDITLDFGLVDDMAVLLTQLAYHLHEDAEELDYVSQRILAYSQQHGDWRRCAYKRCQTSTAGGPGYVWPLGELGRFNGNLRYCSEIHGKREQQRRTNERRRIAAEAKAS